MLFYYYLSFLGTRVRAKFCRIGAILDITVILMFIGDILRVIAYFKLAPLKDLENSTLAATMV